MLVDKPHLIEFSNQPYVVDAIAVLHMRKPSIRWVNLFKVTELISNRTEIQPQQSDTRAYTLNSHSVRTLRKVLEAPAPRCPSLLLPLGNIFYFCLFSIQCPFFW